MKIKSTNFNIRQIAESGQCFRMKEREPGRYGLVAYGKYIELRQMNEDTVELGCNEGDYEGLWRYYFDIDFDYGRIVQVLSEGDDDFLRKAAEYGSGIRILMQEPFEMLISFIISQNKNIPSIKTCIERICERYGEQKVHEGSGTVYHAFPEPDMLAAAKKEELREMKLGYRDEYILRAAQAVSSGEIDLSDLKKCSHEEALKILKTIHGVGDKVASCVSLYGLHHIEAFPVDVWIKKVLNEVYHDKFSTGRFGGFTGIVQQYMFYYKRELDSKKPKSIKPYKTQSAM